MTDRSTKQRELEAIELDESALLDAVTGGDLGEFESTHPVNFDVPGPIDAGIVVGTLEGFVGADGEVHQPTTEPK